MVDNKKLQISFFFVIFGLMSLVIFWIYRPFLEILSLSAIFAVILYPLFLKIAGITKNREVAAISTILLVGIFIAIPIYFIGVQIVKEASNLFFSIQQNGGGSEVLSNLSLSIDQTVNNAFPDLGFHFQSYLQNIIGLIPQNLTPLLSGTAFFLLGALLVIISLFFFLKDGPDFIKGFIHLSPLDDKYDREILETTGRSINSVLRGALGIEIIHGIVVMIGFFIFGVPNAFLWGSLAIIVAAVPGIGTSTIFVPGILYLFYMDHSVAAVGLLLWSFFVHGSVDNFLAPIFYGKGINVHPVFVVFAILGGIFLFGPLGFLFGPIFLSVFIALLHVYRTFILEEKLSGKEGG